MKKLFIPAALLLSCSLQPATAQKAPLKKAPRHTITPAGQKPVPKKPDYSQTSWLPNWVSGEFCEAYSRYFLDLPDLYISSASRALKDTPLSRPEVNLTGALAKSVNLREAVYKTLYEHCYNLKHTFGSSRTVEEMLFLMLYDQLHLNDVAATELTMHIVSRYQLPEPKVVAAENEAEPEATEEQKESAVERKVYTYVEQMPQLPGGGGEVAIRAAIQKAAQYPPLALHNKVEGRVIVSFIVNPGGDVSDVKVVKSLGSGLDEEVARAVYQLPRFVPGQQAGKTVAVSFTVPVTSKLPSSEQPAP